MKKSLLIFQLLIICRVQLINAQTTELIGVASAGNHTGGGVIFKINADGTDYGTLYCFNKLNTVIGFTPMGHLTHGTDGKWYGILNNTNTVTDSGALFSFDLTTHICKRVFAFNCPKGKPPYGDITQADNDKLYIITSSDSAGNILCYNPADNACSKVLNFDTTDGKYPFGGLLLANNGKLYGMTSYGGVHNDGELFCFDPINNTYKKVFDFDGNNGQHPWGNLIQGKNGQLYGMTSGGGVNDIDMSYHGDGVIFSFSLTNNKYKKLYDFKWATGATPQGSLLQAKNGKLCGLTWYGGTYKYGVVFMFNPSDNTYTDLYDFNDTTGSYPQGSLIQAKNDMLYGMTSHGGKHGCGTIFTIDPSNNAFKKIHDFDRANGSLPLGELSEVK